MNLVSTSPAVARAADLIGLACHAPSVHNTQPWQWRIRDDDVVELWADRTRLLPVADPEGRNLTLSCGAALHHFLVAAAALGFATGDDLDLDPQANEPGPLARIRLAPGSAPLGGAGIVENLLRRHTDRRRFTSWPVPSSRLISLAEAAVEGMGGGAGPSGAPTTMSIARAVPVLGATARWRTDLLLSRAFSAQRADARFAHEQRRWTERGSADGIPQPNATPGADPRPEGTRNRFESDHLGRTASTLTGSSGALVESSDGLVAICTLHDTPRAWLEAGMLLSALWLRATEDGLSVVPLSQVVEVPETRQALRHDVLNDLLHPQILVRIGWQEISRATLSPTPRRSLADVLLP